MGFDTVEINLVSKMSRFKNVWSMKILVPKKFLVKKYVWSNIDFEFENICCPKNFYKKNCWSKKVLSKNFEENFDSQNFYILNIFWSKTFVVKKNLVQKNLCQKQFGLKINLIQRILGHTKFMVKKFESNQILVQKNSRTLKTFVQKVSSKSCQ